MATPRIPERAVTRRTHNPPHAEQKLFLAVRALQTTIQDGWLLELMKLLLHRLPPTQPPLPSILPQFNLGSPLQSLLPSSAPPGIIPQRRITPIEERHLRTSSTHKILDFSPLQPLDLAEEREYLNRLLANWSPIQSLDPAEERYYQRLADLKNLLGPLNSENDDSGDKHKRDDSGCVLLCWGSSSDCRALAVNHIERTIDQKLFWKNLQTAWYNTRGRWRQIIPWYGIRSVKQVEIRLVGPDPKAKDVFHGVYQPADKVLESEKQKLWESMSTVTLPHYLDYYLPDNEESMSEEEYHELQSYPCQYDTKRGLTVHGKDCHGLTHDLEEDIFLCPVEEFYKNSERLKRLKMEPLRTLLFQNPNMAVYNELENVELVYSSK
jgi:hypothetical protein